MNLNELLLIDIETIPQYKSYDELDEEWQTLWELKASKLPQKEPISITEGYNNGAGIFAEFGKIICISTAHFFTETDKKIKLKQTTFQNHNEAELLTDFINLCNAFVKTKKTIAFCGHNIKEFDVPYICRRLIANNIPLPKYLQLNNVKPWETNMVDTLHWWRFGDFKNYISLKLLSKVLGIPSSKTDIDGSMVRDVYYEQNDLQRIADYCQKDVQVVAQIIMKFNNKALLEEENFVAQ